MGRVSLDKDVDWKIAVCLGLGMSQEKCAEHLGITRQTIFNHTKKDPEFFQSAVATVKAIRDLTQTANISSAALAAEDRIKSFFDRSFRLSEQLLTEAEQNGADPAQLMEIHKNFTMWAAKFAASEAPKRMKFEGSIEHEHKLIDATVIARLEAVMREQKLLPETIDAEVVETNN